MVNIDGLNANIGNTLSKRVNYGSVGSDAFGGVYALLNILLLILVAPLVKKLFLFFLLQVF